MEQVCRGASYILTALLLVGCYPEDTQGTSIAIPSAPSPGIRLPFYCPNEVTLTKLRMNQLENGFVQYTQYDVDIPTIISFTMHYWFNLDDIISSSTMFSYASGPTYNSDNLLTVLLESEGKGEHNYFTLIINGVLTNSAIFTTPIRKGRWYHALHSWDSQTGRISHFLNGNLIDSNVFIQTKGLVIDGGGVAVSGQNHRASLSDNVDQGEGLDGWFTLFQFSTKPLGNPASYDIALTHAKLAFQCAEHAEGDLISWARIPRKNFGGVTSAPSFSKACGEF